jgi:hypothetical protein
VHLVVLKPDWLALKKHVALETMRGDFARYVKTAGVIVDGEQAECRLSSSRFRRSTKAFLDIRGFAASKLSVILLLEFLFPVDTVSSKRPGKETPILTRSYAADAISAGIVKKAIEITKRHDVDEVRDYTEEITLPSSSLKSVKVEIANGPPVTLNPSYLIVSRPLTLDEVRRKGQTATGSESYALQVTVDIVRDKTVIAVTYQK